ncbi:MAG: hypothetical protein AAB392_03365 [Patescibacteria group bacterium]
MESPLIKTQERQADLPFQYESFQAFEGYLDDMWVSGNGQVKRRLNGAEKNVILDVYTALEIKNKGEANSSKMADGMIEHSLNTAKSMLAEVNAEIMALINHVEGDPPHTASGG